MNFLAILLAYLVFAVAQVGKRVLGILRRRKRWEAATATFPFFPNQGKQFQKHKDERHDYLLSLFPEKTKTIRFTSGPYTAEGAVCTLDPAIVRHILKDKFDIYTKNLPDMLPPINPFLMLMGEGIFAINHGPNSSDQGRSWFHQRKLSAHIFTQKNFRDFFCRVFAENGNILIEQLKQSEGEVVDLQDKFFKYTMDSFGEIGFGMKFRTLEGADNRFATSFDEAHSCLIPFFIMAMPKAIMSDLLLPFPFNKLAVQLVWWFNKITIKFRSSCDVLWKCCNQLIETRRKDPNLAEADDLLSRFLQCKLEDGSPLPPKLLSDIILNLIIAGRDTTACTLSWLFYRLCEHPEVQEKLIAEIDEVLQGAQPDYVNLKQLKYLNGVVYEVLRLHPPVPRDTKIATQDDVLPDGTRVTRGTPIIFFVWGMGRDADLWPDPLAFKPERWMDSEAVSQYDFPVFQGGPRICLGKEMALLEAKTLAAMLLQNFTVTRAPTQGEPVYSKTLTMSIEGGYKTILKAR
eukprot:TRINITY_DN68031_c6_g17_i1.p1 TRINITY_DN68031_c6_g17~~TRINITY_DN68031_c6_g17_i1.p1  ORF type:complete len:517 (+),score=77.13 TRINITY_DN68031_c6_g17_i1:53-1603(+)